MKLIENPTTLAQRIVNAVCDDIYGRASGDHFFDSIEADVLKEMAEELTAIVQKEIDHNHDRD